MTETTNWKEIKPSTIHKFEKEGDSVEGTFVEIRDWIYGKLFDIQPDDGELLTLGSDTVLSSRLSQTFVGKRIKIIYKGKAISEKSKREYNDYQIFIEEDGPSSAAAATENLQKK